MKLFTLWKTLSKKQKIQYGLAAIFIVIFVATVIFSVIKISAIEEERIVSNQATASLTISGQPKSAQTNIVASQVVNVEISNVSVNATSTQAIISWKTNIPATSRIFYGWRRDVILRTPLDSNLVTDHSVIISDLESPKTYYYLIVSRAGSSRAISKGRFITESSAFGGR